MLSVQRPDLGIGTNEMLMRVGGAGLANAGQGGLAAYGAMFDQYGNIQDHAEPTHLAEYEADYRAQQDEQADSMSEKAGNKCMKQRERAKHQTQTSQHSQEPINLDATSQKMQSWLCPARSVL